jgi:mono/diheme cytochrome c family protein/uncharacterized cupredoxin-like copper-binding protein
MNTVKQINAMVVVLFLVLISVGAYTIWDPFRSDAAKTTQDDKTSEFGAETFTLNCRLCHGDRGQGGAQGGRLAVAPPLDTNEFKGIDDTGTFSQALFDTSVRLVTNTITCGRAGTRMPTWGASQGGTLSDEQIRQLVVLITEGHWDLAQAQADRTDAGATATKGATVDMAGGLSAADTTLTVSNAGPFTLGQYIRIDGERMRVLPKQLDVARGVNGTKAVDHALGTAVMKNGQTVQSLTEKMPQDATAVIVGDTSGFAAGDTLQIADETVQVTGTSRGISTTGHVLAKVIGRTPKTILTSGPSGIQPGALIRIDSELMNVTSISNDGDTGAKLDANTTAADTNVSVSKPTFFRPGYQFTVGDEMLQVVGPVDTSQTLSTAIGTAQNTLSISGTTGIETGLIIRMDDELFRVTDIVQPARVEIARGATTAPHSAGAAVIQPANAKATPPTEATPTGQTLLADLSTDGTTANVTGTAKLTVGQQYTIDGETVTVNAIEPAIVKVQRAVGGTKKAEHARRAAIYDGNLLEMKRGVNGTTASAHSAGDKITMTALNVKRQAANSELAEHSKNAEIYLGNDLIVARGLLNTKAAGHANGTLVRNFAPPSDPATIAPNQGPTCSDRAQTGGGTAGPTPTPLPGATKVAVSLNDSPFQVKPDASSAPAGPVEFDVKNDGAGPHNFRVIQTDLAPDKLPLTGSQVDENQLGSAVVARSAGNFIAAGATDTVAAQLAPGNYVLICNVPTHYSSGMHVAFTVAP